jgi:hypothetical protein
MGHKQFKKTTNKRILFPEDDWSDMAKASEINLKDKGIIFDTLTIWKQQHKILNENYKICYYVISRYKH